MPRDVLRTYIRTLLEAAVASNAASRQGLALLRSSKGVGVEYVLYDPTPISNYVSSVEKGRPFEEVAAEIDPNEVIYGYLDVRPHKGDCWDAAEVKFSAARKGYGPLMYELAMSDFGKLMSDHGAGSSNAARKVWKTYSQRSDVKSLPFDDVKNPQTPLKGDDCKMIPDFDGENVYLNQAYAGSGDGAGKEKMMLAHRAFVGKLTASGYQASEIELGIRMMGDEYFGKRYRDDA